MKERERDEERKEIPWTYHLLMTSYMSGPMLELYTYSLTHLGLNVWGLSFQLPSHVQLFVTPWTAGCQDSLSITVSWGLLKLMSIELVMPYNHLVLCCPLLLLPSIFPSVRFFSKSQLFASDSQSTRASASASVLPMNIQNWFPLGWTGWISLKSNRLPRVISNTIAQKHQFFSLLYGPTLTSTHDYWKNHSFDYTDICGQSNVSAF